MIDGVGITQLLIERGHLFQIRMIDPFEDQNMSTSTHFPNLDSIATHGFRDHIFCLKIRMYNNHIITMALKSKTFDIYYNLCPLKSKPLRCASVFKQRSDDATSFVYR